MVEPRFFWANFDVAGARFPFFHFSRAHGGWTPTNFTGKNLNRQVCPSLNSKGFKTFFVARAIGE
jgi:hypothetical protein